MNMMTADARLQDEFNNLFARSYAPIYKYACRLTGNKLDAEDLAMEAYQRAWQAFERYDRNFPFNGWLARILSNLAVDRLRRKRLKTVSLEQLTATGNDTGIAASLLKTPRNEVEQKLLRKMEWEEVELVLSQISTPYRTIIKMVDLEGHSYREAAERLNTTVGIVRSRLYRGRRKFIQLWKDGGRAM